MSKPQLLLLAAPSRESHDKAAHFASAAKALDVPARIVVSDRADTAEAMAGPAPILFALPCSDALALPAARLNERDRCGGLSVGLIGHLVDKASAIPMLSQVLGLPLLPQCLPQTIEDIHCWPWSGAIIVKPTRSSGSWSPRPWGYRRFAGKAQFLHWLRDEGLEAAFFDEQRSPEALGPALLQAALDTRRNEGTMLLLTPSRLQVVYNSYGDFEPGDERNPRWRRSHYCNGRPSQLVRDPSRLEQLRRLNPAAWGRGLLYMQAMRGPDGFHLIDINLRPSTAWDWLVAAADPTMHRRLLEALLFDAPFEHVLPAPVVTIDLVNGEAGRRIASIDHPPLPPHIRPVRLTAADCATSSTGFDRAGAAPAFVTLGEDSKTCRGRAEQFRAGIQLSYTTETAL